MSKSSDYGLLEVDMLQPFLTWLRSRGRVRPESHVVTELPWNGRRVDLAVVSPSGRITSYELKLRNTRRAIEQSSLNTRSFDCSYIVTMTRPSEINLKEAQGLGIGLILLTPNFATTSVLLRASLCRVHPIVRRRLRCAVESRDRAIYV